MSEKDLDDIFRKKLTNREFAFNPSNWEAMEQMLDADKKPAAFYWWSSAAILLFGLFASGIAFMQHGPLGELPTTLPISQEIVVETDQNSIDALSTIKAEETIGKIDKEDISVSTENFVNTEAIVEQTPANVIESNSHNIVHSAAIPNSQDQERANVGDVADVPDNTESNLTVTPESTIFPISNIDQVDYTQSNIVELTPKGFVLSGDQKEFDLITNKVRLNYIRKYQQQHEVSALAGLGVGPAYNGLSASSGWLVGVNYEYRFSYLWSVNAALTYNSKTSLGISHKTDSTFISFAKENIITESKHTRLDYFELPLQVNYTFLPRHQIGIGVYTAAVFNVVTETDRTSFTVKGTEKINFTSQGRSDNFNTFDFGITGSYGFQFSPSINFGAQFKYGFTDVTVNSSLELNGDDRNISGRLILKYRLF